MIEIQMLTNGVNKSSKWRLFLGNLSPNCTMNFGEQLKEIRSSKGLIQIELSEKSGSHLEPFSAWSAMKESRACIP